MTEALPVEGRSAREFAVAGVVSGVHSGSPGNASDVGAFHIIVRGTVREVSTTSWPSSSSSPTTSTRASIAGRVGVLSEG